MSLHRPTLSSQSAQRPPLGSRVMARLIARLSSDQGDVPGWVLITLMTAGIVVALWAVASDALVGLFQQAMSKFS